jgi:hypothetical protein
MTRTKVGQLAVLVRSRRSRYVQIVHCWSTTTSEGMLPIQGEMIRQAAKACRYDDSLQAQCQRRGTFEGTHRRRRVNLACYC